MPTYEMLCNFLFFRHTKFITGLYIMQNTGRWGKNEKKIEDLGGKWKGEKKN